MDFLKEIFKDDELIKNIEFVYDPFVIKSANNNKENIIINIKTLINMGVKNIKDILVTDIQPLFLEPKIFDKMISKYDKEELVNKLNSNPLEINLLYYS